MREHTRNQKRMYRIHKQEEKILEQELMIAHLQQKVEQLENIKKEAIEYIKDKQKIQYKFALSHIECDDLLNILNKGDNK